MTYLEVTFGLVVFAFGCTAFVLDSGVFFAAVLRVPRAGAEVREVLDVEAVFETSGESAKPSEALAGAGGEMGESILSKVGDVLVQAVEVS